MVFIVGSSTFVFGFGRGIISVSFSRSPQLEDLFHIGFTDPFKTNQIEQDILSISRYAPGPSHQLPVSVECIDANSFQLTIAANAAGGNAGIYISDDYFVTSYSYSKNVQEWGQESWSFMSRPEPPQGAYLMVRGKSRGQSTDGETGVVFDQVTTSGLNVEVSAGFPGIGNAEIITYGTVSEIGGGIGKYDPFVGRASVNIPYSSIPTTAL